MSRPIITLTTDFGSADAYVAEMKAAIYSANTDVLIVDVSHEIPPQDVLGGSITLERAVRSFPAGTIHVAVIDPGVGTRRRLIRTSVCGQIIVCPDNGLITWTIRRHGGATFEEILWRPRVYSNTFHGRDVLAPFAAMIANGQIEAKMTQAIEAVALLDIAPAMTPGDARVIHVDHFGNCTTNVPAELVHVLSRVRVKGVEIGPLRQTYADVNRGEALAIVGSSGLLEVAVRDGSAAAELGLSVGDVIEVR